MQVSISTNASAKTAQTLKAELHSALGQLPSFSHCALLDYPSYLNLGDHLIWLGSLFYLQTVANCQVTYTASPTDFSSDALERELPEGPIFLLGGGNLGDLWYYHQTFREAVIERYADRPIVILPQTVFFRESQKLEQARHIFNRHPNLTIFTRDRVSYDIACQAFDHCRVLMAPDAAFQLTDFADFSVPVTPQGLLYHCRTDAELKDQIAVGNGSISPSQVSDWLSYRWLYDNHWLLRPSQGGIEVLKKRLRVRALGHGVRAIWQRRLRHPREWRSLHQWESTHCPKALFDAVHNSARQYQSWSFAHSAVYQFSQYEAIVTNRLHGHILCTLLNIPHVFLPNSYHKNRGFYQAWTEGIACGTFVETLAEVKASIDQLRADQSDLYTRSQEVTHG